MLLFCTMTRALDVVEDYLAWRGFPALRLDGNTSAAERGELVRRFNDPGGWAGLGGWVGGWAGVGSYRDSLGAVVGPCSSCVFCCRWTHD